MSDKLHFWISALVIISTLVGVDWSIHHYLKKSDASPHSRTVIIRICRFVMLFLTIGGVLWKLKVPMAPILASFGIGSLAIALALKDTLENFFSGLYLLIDRPIRVGDYVRVGEGVNAVEGYVRYMGWRSIHIYHSSDSIMVVPNAKIAANSVVNYDLPGLVMIESVPVHFSIDSKMEDVDKLIGELKATLPDIVIAGKLSSVIDGKITCTFSIKSPTCAQASKCKHTFLRELCNTTSYAGVKLFTP